MPQENKDVSDQDSVDELVLEATVLKVVDVENVNPAGLVTTTISSS